MGDPAASIVLCRPEHRLTNSGLIHGPVSRADGDELGKQRWYRQAKETKCGEMDVGGSEHIIVPGKRGNRTSEPRGGKGVPCRGPVRGKHVVGFEPRLVSTSCSRIDKRDGEPTT